MSDSLLAYFVSPHGFGHAARSAAVMEALGHLDPGIQFEIFTTVPEWFFQESLTGAYNYHHLQTDVGLVQKSSLVEDVALTVERLDEFYPFESDKVRELARRVDDLGCACVLCDIAPLGIAVAQAAGLASVLIENFTWDWIYQGYVDADERLSDYVDYLHEVFETADYHIQTEPVCEFRIPDLVTRPVSRPIRTPRLQVRTKLGIPPDEQAVLVTMGGIGERHSFIEQLAKWPDIHFVVPGASDHPKSLDNVILLPHHSEHYHPDLLNACDAVIGKSGYSTVAETFYAGIPFGYVSRARFREAPVMARFIQEQMRGIEIAEEVFVSGRWLSVLPELLGLERVTVAEPNGSHQIARFVHRLMQ